MGALGVLLPLVFVAFSLRGGVLLRVSGWLCLVVGIFTPFSAHGSAGDALACLVIGAVLWLAGHWAYAFAYYHYKSPVAERVIERGIFPLVNARPGQYRAQGPTASALRNSGTMISRGILRSASGVDKARPPAAPADVGEQMPAAERDATTPSPVEAARGHVREAAVSFRERVGVSSWRYERLRESLAKEQALSIELREQVDALMARDRAREGRLGAVLADAATFVRGLDRTCARVQRADIRRCQSGCTPGGRIPRLTATKASW